MISSLLPVLALLSVSINEASACGGHDGHHYQRRSYDQPTPVVKRGEPYPSTDVGYIIPTPISAITTLPADYSSTTLPVAATYTEGATPSLAGAPLLPAPTINHAAYPSPDAIPPTDNVDLVSQWMAEIDWTTIPEIEVNQARNCTDPRVSSAVASAGADQNCWWTCGGCVRDIDITTCGTTMEYGLGFDDGPGLYTPKLLRYLEANDLHATFYLVGSRVYYRPEMVRYEYMTGHHLSVHTWSHGGADQIGLTMMTNEQIVAELGYTKMIIKEATGVTPTTMRPPFGDIDDRVRAISLAMGLIPIIWTSKPDPANPGTPIQWDSGDFDVHLGQFPAASNQQRFEGVLDTSNQFTDHGVIALQHDLFSETVDLAIGYTIPYLLAHNFTLKPVLTCNGRSDLDVYQETNTNTNGPAQDDGDVATRSSNLGYALSHHNDPTAAPSRTYNTSAGHGTATSTPTTSRNSSVVAVGSSVGTPLAALIYLGVVLGISLGF